MKWTVWRWACLLCAALMLSAVAQFYDAATGFTSLISIGSKLGTVKLPALKNVPHHVYEDSYGYDGAYYVQIALDPLLKDPVLRTSVDNLPYRARRILLSWVAWGLGGGKAFWIVQIYPMINVVSWLLLAALLWRWFPPDSWENFLRWAGVMFSHGLLMSLRHSLVDGPSLLLVAVAVALVESGRRNFATTMLAVAALGKETSLLAAPALLRERESGWRAGVSLAARCALLALPLAAWLIYLRWHLGRGAEAGLNNFALPLMGIFEKWITTIAEIGKSGLTWPLVATLLTIVALSVQFGFVAVRWRPKEIWWRVAAPFAALTAMVTVPVWEGYPGAATRVVLPLTLAFNVLVPRGRRWLPLLLAGNLSVLAGLFEFTPPREFYHLTGRHSAVAQVQVESRGWYFPEFNREHRWRWSRQESTLVFTNHGTSTIEAEASCWVRSLVPRRLTVRLDDEVVWSDLTRVDLTKITFKPFTLTPGPHRLVFSSDEPGEAASPGDTRPLAFAVYDLEVAVVRATNHTNK